MTTYSQVEALLIDFVLRIRSFEDLLADSHGHSHFDWREIRTGGGYARRGMLPYPCGHVTYFFHGSGCTLNFPDAVIDYDYVRYLEPPTRCPIRLEPWKFSRAIHSMIDGCYDSSPDRDLIEASSEWLRRLAAAGRVTRLPDGFDSYEVNETVLGRGGDAA